MACDIIIEYKISSTTYENTSWVFKLDNEQHRCHIEPESQNMQWQKLECNQCKHCPYQTQNKPYCPVAQSIGSIAEYFKDISSIEVFELTVFINQELHFQAKASAARVCSSLIGLSTAGSGCQYTQFLWPMLQQHTPMATLEESVFRAISNMSIYYVLNDSPLNFIEYCTNFYENMHTLNIDFSARIQQFAKGDALNNGLINLDTFIKMILYNLEHKFEDFQDIYDLK
ncbi:DUF6901 family protein [Marinicellulosiphila megalodicopiae]|uniref:DUF6901 family protein n=1 Tax=Marinicellulosiphila megalodicopiae TaxID=2724896 RepID=UPI003BB03162